MHIYVSRATLHGTNLQAGDEIGIFDGEECVGVGFLTEEITGDGILLIEALRAYFWWPGFTPGDTISYRFCSQGELVNHPVIPTYISNGPTFVTDGSCVVELDAINNAPTFLAMPDTVATEDLPYAFSVTAMDMDGDSLIYRALLLPPWLAFNAATHMLSGTPLNSDVGDNQVILSISDGFEEVILNFMVTVENVNDPPTVSSVPLTEARPGVAYSYTVIAEDIDGDSLSYSALVLPAWLSFNGDTHTLSATPGEQDVGDSYVNIRISDGALYTDHIFVIAVSNANHAPFFTSEPPTTVVVGDSYYYAFSAQDMDGDPLTFSAPVLPEWLDFDPDNHSISGIPDSSNMGCCEVHLQVSDGASSAEQNFPVFVENVNTPPCFTSTPTTLISAGELYIYTAEAEDAEDDHLTYWALILPDWLSFNASTQTLHGIPSNNNAGDHYVALRVTDGEETNNQDFIISVEFVYATEMRSTMQGVRIYPNPTDGIFFVECTQRMEKEMALEIMDETGKILWQDEFFPGIFIHKKVDLSFRHPGLYFVRIYNDSFRTVRKLIIY